MRGSCRSSRDVTDGGDSGGRPAAPATLRWAVAMAISTATLVAAGRVAADEPFQPIDSLRSLSAERLAEQPAVRIKGVITQRLSHWFILQDATGGIRVDFRPARSAGVWAGSEEGPPEGRVGLGMEVDGVVMMGEVAPTVLPRSVRFLAPEPLPAARPADDDRLFSGADESERVAVQGIVRSATDGSAVRLVLDRHGRRFEALVVASALPQPAETLIDALVEVIGPVVGFVNTRRELILPKMWVFAPENITVVRPRRHAPFDAPLVPLRELATFRPEPFGGHMVRIRGTATHAVPGSLVYLQEGACGVRVETSDPTAIRPGDVVEAVGFVERRGDAFVHGLDDALVRVVAPGPSPAAVDITPDAIMALNKDARDRDVTAEPGDYDGALVRFPARLVEVKSSPEGSTLVLAAGNTLVQGILGTADVRARRGIVPESELLVTGIARLAWAPDPATGRQGRPTDFTLLVRDAGDIAVLRPAPYWTRRRLLGALAVAAISLATVLAWVWLLRRQVAAQVTVIKETLRHEAVSGERRRIAREFHDSLEQGLAGMAMRLDAASRRLEDASAREVLRQHRGLVGRLQAETRDFLRDLREPPGSEATLASGLEAIVAAAEPLSEARISLDVPEATVAVAPAIQHDVLRIIREAVANAVRHAAPRTVTVIPRSTGCEVRIAVADDGVGFDLALRSAVPGHYGIRGMQERAERIGGRLTVETAAGRGTRVELTVPALAAEVAASDAKKI